MIKRKWILELDEPPALVFVQPQGKQYPVVYQDGQRVHGIRAVSIRGGVDEPTTHEIEYVTGHTSKNEG